MSYLNFNLVKLYRQYFLGLQEPRKVHFSDTHISHKAGLGPLWRQGRISIQQLPTHKGQYQPLINKLGSFYFKDKLVYYRLIYHMDGIEMV